MESTQTEWIETDTILSTFAPVSRSTIFGFLTVVLIVMAVLCLSMGAVYIPPRDIALALLAKLHLAEPVAGFQSTLLWNLRLPRVLLGITVGGCLGACGAALQSLFRNPLAEPGLIGVSSGAALGAVAATCFCATLAPAAGGLFLIYALPLAAFITGAIATVGIYILATWEGKTDVTLLLLGGIAINAIMSACVGLLVYISDDRQLRSILFWMFGSLSGAMWDTLLPYLPLIVMATVLLASMGRYLNLFLLGESEAGHIGVRIQRVKCIIVFLTALGVGASVALSGAIGFAGLIVPHLLRVSLGPDNRTVMPASMLLGGILLLGADLAARTIVAPAELPIGMVTSFIGGPFFLYLLIRRRSGEES